ncbi:MAG: papain fold toxin domain-containing protein [Scytonema sp. PMC 1069.18]|nr:papain fold toxin domain-containing protein [Scytonema sp. PMC 1069.18]MEC4880599.1 papain fold toxin domain-containing protein [Scytonema sp. PMC 1070.18]
MLDASGESSNLGESGEVTPEVLQDIHDIVNRYQNFECVECADEIEEYLKMQKIRGRRIKLDTTRQVRDDDYIYDDSLPEMSNPIATNGHHEGIAIRINEEEKVFDNHHPDGVLTAQWMNNLQFISKVHGGASFRKSGYLF